jgi:hypothetical protein
MSRYDGNRSLDAEIYLNFENGELKMDYSKNKYGNPFNSQTCIMSSTDSSNTEWRKEPLKVRTKHAFIHSISNNSRILPIVFLHSLLSYVGIIRNPETHYKVQRFMRWRQIKTDGIYSQTVSGEQHDPYVVITLPSNMWFEYALEGEYREYIRKLSFTRRFVDHKRYGIYPQRKQEGWNVIFDFTQPPKSGSCTVSYV